MSDRCQICWDIAEVLASTNTYPDGLDGREMEYDILHEHSHTAVPNAKLTQLPEPTSDAEVFGEQNVIQGHLRIDVEDTTYVFLNTSRDHVHFGAMAGPTGRLNTAQLRIIAQYCTSMANRIEARR